MVGQKGASLGDYLLVPSKLVNDQSMWFFPKKKNIFVALGMRVISPWLIIYETFFACSIVKNVFKIEMEMAYYF